MINATRMTSCYSAVSYRDTHVPCLVKGCHTCSFELIPSTSNDTISDKHARHDSLQIDAALSPVSRMPSGALAAEDSCSKNQTSRSNWY